MNLNQQSAANRASAVAASRKGAVYRIEGEYVSGHQIAERLGIKYAAACARLAKLRKASGAVTWKRLEGVA